MFYIYCSMKWPVTIHRPSVGLWTALDVALILIYVYIGLLVALWERSLVGYSPWSHQESVATKHVCIYGYKYIDIDV